MTSSEIKVFYVVFVLFLTTGCSLTSKEMVAFGRVTSQVDLELAKEENLHVFGTGYLGSGYFKGINLSYTSQETVDQAEARRIFLRSVDTVIRIVNQDQQFMQYIDPPPFKSNQLLFSILFDSDFTDRYIGMVIMAHDSISYYLTNPETFKSTKIATETLEEARAILKADDLGAR